MYSKALLAALGVLAVAFAGCTSPANDEQQDATLGQLRATYVDRPFKGGQPTPEHTWLLASPDTVLFLHWNHMDPDDADGLMFVGDGFRAKGCIGAGGVSQAQIDDGFVHFHKETESNWDRGHHTDAADPDLQGWWLRHVGAIEGPGPMPGMPAIVRGEVYPLMPSHENAPACA